MTRAVRHFGRREVSSAVEGRRGEDEEEDEDMGCQDSGGW